MPATATAPQQPKAFDYDMPLPRLRGDLKISRQIYRSKVSYVVKDPVALKYYRMGEMEMHVAEQLDGRRTMRQVLEIVRRDFPWERIDERLVEETFRYFFHLSLLKADPVMATRIYDGTRARPKKLGRLLSELGMLIFYFKVPLFDPDLVLFRLDRWLGFIWSRLFFLLWLLLLGTAMWTVFNNLPKLHENLGNMLTLHNIFLLWVTTMGIKIFHEFGHGLACKHYGGEVHEMGAAFILLSPFLYCDATDSWMFADKRRKLVVTMGGIYVELFIAAICAFVWANTDRGLVNQLAYNAMVVASITTVLFNANPLMRFDGYYALADMLDVPNLREKARRYILGCATSATVGGTPTQEMIEIREETALRRVIFTLFAIASYLYSYFIVFRVIKIVGVKLEPMGLAKWGQALEIAFCATGIIIPFYAFGREIRNRLATNPRLLMNPRIFKFLLITLLVLAGFLAWPWTTTVTTEFVLFEGNHTVVHTEPAGFVRRINVKAGEIVRAGQVLALLDNVELKNRQDDMQSNLEVNYVRRRLSLAAGDPGAIRQTRINYINLASAKQKVDHEVDLLTIRSPIDGIVVTEDLDSHIGEMLSQGDAFCELIPLKKILVSIALNEREAGMVKINQPLEFRTYAFPDRVFKGVVSKVFAAASETLPSDAMAARSGGDIPTGVDSQGRERPLLPTFQAELEIENSDGLLRPGMSGRGRIECGRSTLGLVVYRKVRDMIKSVL